MSLKLQNRSAKKRLHNESDNVKKVPQKELISTRSDVESRSSSCGSKKSNKVAIKNNNKEKNRDVYFNVEKIIGMKTCQGRLMYKVRWQGYEDNDDSWEPEENLKNVLDLVEEFLKRKEGEVANSVKVRNSGGFEYVPSNKVVACKTKYFDDIRDGKIDLTKNDLYSRVKTRKRLQSEAMEVEETIVLEEVNDEVVLEPTVSSRLGEKNKYYQVNLFEMTEEFMKNNNFDKCLTTKSSTNDDISSFNCSVSPDTNHSTDDLLLSQVSPHHSIFVALTQSVGTQTEITDIKMQSQTPVTVNCEDKMEPFLKKVIHRMNESMSRREDISVVEKKVVTSETHLLSIYSKQVRMGPSSAVVLPLLDAESDLVSVDSIDDVRSAIMLNKYALLKCALESGLQVDWTEPLSPENVSPLFLAVSKNQSNIVRLMLRFGAPVDFLETSQTPETVLQLASGSGHIQVVRALLEHGASTDLRGLDGKNALCYAIERGRVNVVRMLLQQGTDFFRVSGTMSAASIVSDLLSSNRLSKTVSLDLLSLLKSYHLSFITSLNRTVSRYLARQTAKQTSLIFPHQWVSVIERECHIDFLLDHSLLLNLHTPILLLVHGLQADCDFEFWLDNNCCCVDSVYVNDECQSSLGTNKFVTTLWPLKANTNKLTVRFSDPTLLSKEERLIRVAVVAVSITCNTSTGASAGSRNANTSSVHIPPSHSRHYH